MVTLPQRVAHSLPSRISRVGSSHPDAESTHLQDLLIVLRLRLLHLGRGIDIILQIRTHMLQRAKALDEDVGGLPKPSLARPKSNPGTPSTYLAAIRVGNGLIIADRRLAGDGGVGAAQGAGALRETRLRGAGGGRHDDGCGGGGGRVFNSATRERRLSSRSRSEVESGISGRNGSGSGRDEQES